MTIATRSVSETQAVNYLRKAEGHFASALEALAADRWDSALLLAVHAAISAGDAVTVHIFGLRSASQTHMDQARLIQQLFPDRANARKATDQLRALLDRKNAVEYEARLSRQGEAETAVKQAERLVDWARSIVRE